MRASYDRVNEIVCLFTVALLCQRSLVIYKEPSYRLRRLINRRQMVPFRRTLLIRFGCGENKLAFPLRDYYAGKTITRCVNRGSPHIHQSIYTEQ